MWFGAGSCGTAAALASRPVQVGFAGVVQFRRCLIDQFAVAQTFQRLGDCDPVRRRRLPTQGVEDVLRPRPAAPCVENGEDVDLQR